MSANVAAVHAAGNAERRRANVGGADDPRGGRAAGRSRRWKGRSGPQSAKFPAAPLVLIDVRTNEGVVGRSYVFAYTQVALAALTSLVTEIGAELQGARSRRWRGWRSSTGASACSAGRGSSAWRSPASTWRCGTRWRAPSTGRSAELLGGKPTPLPAYDSFGMIDPRRGRGRHPRLARQGFRAIKIKIGGGDFGADVATVAAVREHGRAGHRADGRLQPVARSAGSVPARRAARRASTSPGWRSRCAAEDLDGHARVRAATGVRCRPARTGGSRRHAKGGRAPAPATTPCPTS